MTGSPRGSETSHATDDGPSALGLPLVSLLIVAGALWSRSSRPFLASGIEALLLAPFVAAGAALVLAGAGVRGGVRWRMGAIAGALLFPWMAIATTLGWSRFYWDEPMRHILLLASAFGVGLVAGRSPASRRLLAHYAALLGAVIAGVSWWLARVAPAADGRWLSPLESPALLGCFLCLSLPATVGWAASVWRAGPSRSRLVATAALAAASLVQARALLGSGSRLALGASVLALGAWGALLLCERSRAGRWGRAGLWACIGLAGVAIATLTVAPSAGHESSALHRAFIWRTDLRIVAREPWTGVGVGSFRTAFRACRPWVGVDRSDTLAVVRDAHNDVLEVAAEAGLPGALLFLAVLGGALVPRRRGGAPSDPASAGLRVGLAAWALNGLANGSVDVAPVAMLAFAYRGALLGEGGPPPRPAEARAGGRGRRLAVIAVSATAALAWLGGQASLRLAEAASADRGRASEAGGPLYPGLDALLEAEARCTDERARDRVQGWLLALYPAEAEPHARRARRLEAVAPAAGLAEARRAVELDAYNPYYRRQLGEILLAAGDRAEARAQLALAIPLFERTLEVAMARNGPTSPEAEAVRGEIERARGAAARLGPG